MALSSDLPEDVPFSLVCEACDAGMELESYEAAIAAGWTQVASAPELISANYVGLCPHCRRQQEGEQLLPDGDMPSAGMEPG